MSDVPASADYVIVGAGSAGAVLANRLSENPATQVMLIEAGGEGRDFLVQLPVGYAKIVGSPKLDWAYEQEPDASINGRSWIWSAGKMLGGGSSLNGQVYIRGTRDDFDRWEAAGAVGWGFHDVFPYFLKSETWSGSPSQAHGSHGPLSVSPLREANPLCKRFIDGCGEIGLPFLEDYNDGASLGAFYTQASQKDGWRHSTEKAYLRPIRSRPNLHIVTHAEVEAVQIEEGRAIGVTLVRKGSRHQVNARREVCVCAGAMGSPALLMRSGIGPADHLRARGVAVVRDAPSVGANLQEHPGIPSSRFVNVRTLNQELGAASLMGHFARFLLHRKGPLTSPAVQAMALAKTREGLEQPDVQLHFSPLGLEIDASTRSPAMAAMAKEAVVTIYATVCQPRSRGRVELGARREPRVVHQLVGDERDVATLRDGLRLIARLFETPAFRQITTGPRYPSSAAPTDEELVEHIRRSAVITWHPVGTCRMGSDAASVVDPQLRVRGLSNLRVADASVMPTITSCNTNAPTIMIGEKAADLIRLAS